MSSQGIGVFEGRLMAQDDRTMATSLEAQAGAVLAARAGILLPGWRCAACYAFNGSARERLAACRCCGVAR